uniref:Protease PrsW n=1 Tax=Grammatophora oceanica TaxID=210454 RepID=A0A7S1UR98_9STRA
MTQIVLGLLLSLYNMKVISFDLCVKAFTCGFALAATTAFAWEACFSFVVRVISSLLLQEDFYDYNIHSSNGADASASVAPIDLFGSMGDNHPSWYLLYLFLYSFPVAALLEELCKYLGYRMIADHADFWTKRELDETVHATKNTDQLEDLSLGSHSISSLTNATEVQNFSRSQRSTILLVAMIQVSLGFATFENLIYSFLDSRQCLWRAFFPIHALCAFWQGIRVGRRDVESDLSWQVGRILLPSVLLHGIFDFLMGLVYFLGRANQTKLVGEITSALIAVSLLVAGVGCSWIEYVEQRRRLLTPGQASSTKRGGLSSKHRTYLSPIESGNL